MQELTVTPSTTLLVGFIILPIFIASGWIWAIGRAYAEEATSFNKRAAAWASLLVATWLTSAAFIGYQDWAHTFDSFPPPAVRTFLVFITLTIVIAFSKVGKFLSQRTPLWLLIGFQVFRIPLELLIYQAYSENITIVQMTYLGRNFDILTGILALVIALYAFKREVGNKVILMWNILGLVLLVNVVSTGVMSMPHNFQIIDTTIPNIWVTFFPFIWLPLVLVCSALFGHLLIFRYLVSRKKCS